MTLNSIRQAGVSPATLALCFPVLASAPSVHAQDKMTAQTLIDRQLILDQITRYYYNFGKVERQSEESFHAEDGELILGTRHYKGHEGIKQAYNRAPAAPPGAGPHRGPEGTNQPYTRAPAAPPAGATPAAGAAPATGAVPAAAAAPPRE